MKQPVNFAVLGFGGAGRAHVRRLLHLSNVQVVKVFDPNIARSVSEQQRYPQIEFTDSFEGVLDGTVNAVSICTPDHTHFEYAVKCVESGLHTLVEKPLFVSAAECQAMARLLQDSPVVFGVHHQMRYVPAFRAAQQLVHQGGLGKVVAIEADYIHDMRKRATSYDDWRVSQTHPQSIVLGGLSHTIDLVRWIIGEEVHQIFSFADRLGWSQYPDVDTTTGLLRFSSGAIGKVTKTITSSGPQRNRISVYGTQGQIHNNVFYDRDGNKELTVNPQRGGRALKKLLLNMLSRPLLFTDDFRDYPFSVYEHEIACRALLADFVNAVRGNCDFGVGFEEGCRTVELCLAYIQAYQSTQAVNTEKGFSER